MAKPRKPMRRSTWLLLGVLAAVALWKLCLAVTPLLAQDWQEWPVYDATAPETAQLTPSGPDLRWDPPVPQGETRLFVSDHPETLGIADYDPEANSPCQWPRNEGTLWADETTKLNQLDYQVFISHQNWFAKPIALGLLVDNLSVDPLTVSGRLVSTPAKPTDDQREEWLRLTAIGRRNAYAELSGKLWRELPITTVPPGQRILVYAWTLSFGETVGARVKLSLQADGQPVHCRLATTWAWSTARLTDELPLIPRGDHHPRGAWMTAALKVYNAAHPFDLAWQDPGGRTVRCIRLCQPDYDAKGVKTYRPDAIFTRERSYNAQEALANNGCYGALTHVMLHVKNSDTRPHAVGLYLRYPDKRLNGSYVGAAQIFNRDPATGAWTPGEARAVHLGTNAFTVNLTGKVVRDARWVTHRLASYPVAAGQKLVIPLNITHDFPAMLPFGILLVKEQ